MDNALPGTNQTLGMVTVSKWNCNEGSYLNCPKLYGQIWLLVWLPLRKTSIVSNRQSFENNPKTWDVCSRSTIIDQERLKCSSVRPIWWKISAFLVKTLALQTGFWCRWYASVKKKRKVSSRFKSGKRESYHYHENLEYKYKQVTTKLMTD